MWLRANNPFYQGVELQQPDALEDGAAGNIDLSQWQHSVLSHDHPVLGQGTVEAALRGAASSRLWVNQDGRPISVHATAGVEAIAFVKLFPTGSGHFDVARGTELSANQYCSARILSADERCQDPQYIAHLTTLLQHSQLRSQVKVALRSVDRSPTVAQVVNRLEQQNRNGVALSGEGKKVWGFLEELKGSAPYWARSGRELSAMSRALGPATWFITLTADQFGWDDLAVSLLNSERARRGEQLIQE